MLEKEAASLAAVALVTEVAGLAAEVLEKEVAGSAAVELGLVVTVAMLAAVLAGMAKS